MVQSLWKTMWLFLLKSYIHIHMGLPRWHWWSRTQMPMQETQEAQVWSLDWEDPLEEGMAIHSSILAWKIPWTEEPAGLCSKGSQRAGYHWSDLAHTHVHSLKIPCLVIYPEEGKIYNLYKNLYVSVYTPSFTVVKNWKQYKYLSRSKQERNCNSF